jgi:ubiquinone/menaquinone biosynthesis C-methylase UbiE
MSNQNSKKHNKAQNSWGAVASWYDKNLDKPNTFQSQVIMPNLARLVKISPNSEMLDLACGQGYFCQYFEDKCQVTGIDISAELIEIASKSCKKTKFVICPAERIETLKLKPFDIILTVLALQNIADLNKTIANVSQVMKTGAKWYIVLNHPCFRQIKKSSWSLNKESKINERVLTGYMSSYSQEIIMNPSDKNSARTLTYHRPLQEYIKIAKNNQLCLSNLEEWVSHVKQDNDILEKSKNEFPVFMYLEFTKL